MEALTVERYRKFNTFLRGVFGEKVFRVGLCGGFTCPNRDGTLGVEGCIFCNPASSEPLGYDPGMSITEQLDWGTEYVRGRHGVEKYIAFFSDYSTTYTDAGRLEAMYREAASYPSVVGLALCTRPDCLPDAVLDVLEAIAGETFLWVELGVQTSNPRSMDVIRRRHTVDDTRRAIARLRSRNIAVSGHVILGLPGESMDEMLDTARFLAETGVDGAKIHNLHVVRDTPLAEMHQRGKYRVLELEEYVDLAVRFLERLPPSLIVQRMTGEAPRRLTVAPEWSVNKLAVLNAIARELDERGTWQGKGLGFGLEDLQAPVSVPGTPTRTARG